MTKTLTSIGKMFKTHIGVRFLESATVIITAALLFGVSYSYSHMELNDGYAKNIAGKNVVVSVFVSDEDCSWDFSKPSDAEKRENCLEYLRTAVCFIESEVKRYGHSSEFIFDYTKSGNEGLYREASLKGHLSKPDMDVTMVDEFIGDESKNASLASMYQADGVLYILFLNTKEGSTIPSNSFMCLKENDPADEFCLIYTNVKGWDEGPAVIAHEILHLFGAPDLYFENPYNMYPEIDEAYINRLYNEKSNDIMFTCVDAHDGTIYYDHISNEITNVDAKYLGLTDN